MPTTDDKERCGSPLHGSGGQPQAWPVVMTDALGNTWCQDCLHRGEFINWGKAHGWPEMEVHPYALLQGEYFWRVTATMADEDRMWSFLSLIEMLEKEAEVA